MKRTSVLVWALGIVLAAAGPAAFGDDSEALVVDDDTLDCPNAEYTSIQAAVNAAEPGATIHVCAGIYHEQVTITKDGLRLLVKGPRGGAVVDADLLGHAIWVQNASGVRIEGFTVREGESVGILLDGATKARIRNNLTTATGHDGIELFNSDDNVVERNISYNNPAFNACGINLAGGSDRNVIRHNVVTNNEFGIQVFGPANDNVISRNWAIGNRGNGIRNVGGASGTRIERNRAFSNGFAPVAAGTNNAGIFIGGGTGIVVARNHAFDNTTVDLRSNVAATAATFDDNRCNTSIPDGLCTHGGDSDSE